MDERKRILRFEKVDIVIAMALAGAVNLSMMIMAAALFHEGGLTGIDTIEGAYAGLQDTVSNNAATIFGIALLASGFASSSVGTMAGQVVMQGFIERRIPIFVRRAITLAPALVILAIGVNPTDALVASQVVLSFGIPFALIPLLLIARRKDVMGAMANPGWLTALAGVLGEPDHRPQRLPPAAGLLRLSPRGTRPMRGQALGLARMSLAHDFQEILDSLTDDWTDLALDVRLPDEERYVDAAVILTQVNAQPYSKADWHWRINVAHQLRPRRRGADGEGNAGAARPGGHRGRDGRPRGPRGSGRGPQMWGRPESVRQEFRKSRTL